MKVLPAGIFVNEYDEVNSLISFLLNEYRGTVLEKISLVYKQIFAHYPKEPAYINVTGIEPPEPFYYKDVFQSDDNVFEMIINFNIETIKQFHKANCLIYKTYNAVDVIDKIAYTEEQSYGMNKDLSSIFAVPVPSPRGFDLRIIDGNHRYSMALKNNLLDRVKINEISQNSLQPGLFLDPYSFLQYRLLADSLVLILGRSQKVLEISERLLYYSVECYNSPFYQSLANKF